MSHYTSSRYPDASAAAYAYPGYSTVPPSTGSRGGAYGYAAADSRYHPYGGSSSTMDSSRHTGGYPMASNGGGGGYGGQSRYGGDSGGGGGYRGGQTGGRFSSSTSSLYSRGGEGSRVRRGKNPRNEFGIAFGQPGAGLSKIDWERLSLPEFQKNFYREAPTVTNLPNDEMQAWRDKHEISVYGADIPRPIRTFEEAGFPEYIMQSIRRAGFAKPTPIQSQGWPMAMSGRDVVGVAETGSGKTLGFLLPGIVHINAQPLLRKGDGPIVLIVAPTRELAVQIEGEASKFAYSSKIKHTCVYGGVSRRDQARTLQEGVEIIICTPGRLLDFLESGTTNLRRVTYMVIDEADRLLDMGFEPQLKAIFSQIRPDRQILMWSATWPKEVRSLAGEFTSRDTIQVSVGSLETKANHDVTQNVEVLQPWEKQMRLFKFLREQWTGPNAANTKVLVFTATKRMCDELNRCLRRDNWPSTAIHGDKEQFVRDTALNDFKSGRCPIMLATDVASRGIHVDDITHVVNYDFPGNIEDYVHRIGRTGRCGKKGIAISFFTKDDGKRAGALIKVLSEANQIVPQELQGMSGYRGGGRGGFGGGDRYRQVSKPPPVYGGPSAGGYPGGDSHREHVRYRPSYPGAPVTASATNGVVPPPSAAPTSQSSASTAPAQNGHSY